MAPSFSSSPEPEPSTSAVPHPSTSSFSSTHPTLPSSSSSAAVAHLPPSIKLDLDAELDELLDGPQPPAASTALAADTKPRAGGAGAKSSGLGKGWRAGKGTGKGKSKKKKVEVEEAPNKYRDKFVGLRDEYDLTIRTKTRRTAELQEHLETLNRIQAENDFLIDAARKTLGSRPSLKAALERTTSPPPPPRPPPPPAPALPATPAPPAKEEADETKSAEDELAEGLLALAEGAGAGADAQAPVAAVTGVVDEGSNARRSKRQRTT